MTDCKFFERYYKKSSFNGPVICFKSTANDDGHNFYQGQVYDLKLAVEPNCVICFDNKHGSKYTLNYMAEHFIPVKNNSTVYSVKSKQFGTYYFTVDLLGVIPIVSYNNYLGYITWDEFKEKIDLDTLSVYSYKEEVNHQSDNLIRHPGHYTYGKIETWDFIADKKLDFFLGNVIKYVTRAGHKDGSSKEDDLLKAEQYIKKELALVKEVPKKDSES